MNFYIWATVGKSWFLLVLHPSMLEPEKCPSEANFWWSSMLDARFFHTRCNTAFENRHILAKIVHFWSNARAKARSCRIFQCSSMLEPEFWFSSMLEPAQYSNIHFRACSSPLDARLFHTRCNTIAYTLATKWGTNKMSFQRFCHHTSTTAYSCFLWNHKSVVGGRWPPLKEEKSLFVAWVMFPAAARQRMNNKREHTYYVCSSP